MKNKLLIQNTKNLKKIQSFLVLLIALFLTGCRTMPTTPNIGMDTSKALPLEYLCPDSLSWQPLTNKGQIQEGFEVIKYEMEDLRVRWICVKVDLTTPGLQVVATPYPEEKGKSPTLRHVKTFAKETNAIVAINATPWNNRNYPNNAVGIVKIDDVEYFPVEKSYSAICFTKNPLRAKILPYQTEEEIEKYEYAFGGFSQVLQNGKLIPYNNDRRSRTVIGTNEDGTEAYFFLVSTIANFNDRNGFTFEECGMILQKLGATDAMHFDGGHSSCIVLNGNQSQKPFLNRKIPIAIGLKK